MPLRRGSSCVVQYVRIVLALALMHLSWCTAVSGCKTFSEYVSEGGIVTQIDCVLSEAEGGVITIPNDINALTNLEQL
jgi:hypothetical protein